MKKRPRGALLLVVQRLYIMYRGFVRELRPALCWRHSLTTQANSFKKEAEFCSCLADMPGQLASVGRAAAAFDSEGRAQLSRFARCTGCNCPALNNCCRSCYLERFDSAAAHRCRWLLCSLARRHLWPEPPRTPAANTTARGISSSVSPFAKR